MRPERSSSRSHPRAVTRFTRRVGLGGPPFAWPAAVDRVAIAWAGLPPRLRTVVVIGLVVALVVGTRVQVQRAEARWGGTPVVVWIAEADTGVGEVALLRRVRLPPAAVPPGAVDAPTDEPLRMPLPEGAVLTTAHTAADGPAAGLPDGTRLVPIPVDAGWGVTVGSRVDVWVEGAQQGSRLVAPDRSVIEVRGDEGSGHQTALVALEHGQVPAVTAALAQGAVLLSIVPGS